MTFGFELDQWNEGYTQFVTKDYAAAVKIFTSLSNAKVHFNAGHILTIIEQYLLAKAAFTRAIQLDKYFAVAYYGRAAVSFAQGLMEEAIQDYNVALGLLRAHPIINYQQLGLDYKLYRCEIMANIGICRLHQSRRDDGLGYLYAAQEFKMSNEHNIITEMHRNSGKGYSIFTVPREIIFKPKQKQQSFAEVNLTNIKKESLINNSTPLHNYSNNFGTNKTVHSIVATQPGIHHNIAPQTTIPNITERTREELNYSLYQNERSKSTSPVSSSTFRYRYPKHQEGPNDSGFESATDDRYSSSSSSSNSRSSMNTNKKPLTKSGNNVVVPAVPPIPEQHSVPVNYDLDQYIDSYSQPEKINLHKEQDRTINEFAYNSNNRDELHMVASTSSSTAGSNCSSLSPAAGKIKVKVHYNDTRTFLINESIRFEELRQKVQDKFKLRAKILLQYKDEDDEKVLIVEDADLELAIATNRAYSNTQVNGMQKLEIWCIAQFG